MYNVSQPHKMVFLVFTLFEEVTFFLYYAGMLVMMLMWMYNNVISRLSPPTALQRVKEFTEASGFPCPSHPTPMSKEASLFLTKMILDEVLEFLVPLMTAAEAKQTLRELVADAKVEELYQHGQKVDSTTVLTEQMDALIDVQYYMLNAACKHGMNIDHVFDLVHAANMAKRDPMTGQFIKRDDGKILKPDGWKEPDVKGEVVRQCSLGSWM
jgi:predicted HAD superfamily Cof-like phosphohydrolase